MSLRSHVLRGGAYLALREMLGIVVRLGGVLALTRLLGPADFGVYAGAAAIVTFLGYIAQWGTEIFLIRREHEPSSRLYDETFTFLLVSTGCVATAALGVTAAVGALAGASPFLAPLAVLIAAVPLNALWAPAQARLERGFQFRALALLELGGDAVLYTTAVGLALLGAGVWGPVVGYLAWQGFLLAASYRMARFRPRPQLSRGTAIEILRFGLSYSLASWIERGRELVNPLVVGPLLGAAAVGYVAVALRLGETLSFVTRATWRVSIVALGRVQSDLVRVRRALEEGMVLQVLTSGAVLTGFSLVAAQAVPLVFGDQWRPALEVFPFVAGAYLLMAGFALHNSLLYVLRRNRRVAAINALRVVTLTTLSLVLLPLVGVAGYGLALLGAQASAVLLDREVRKLFQYRLARALPWLVGLLPPMFVPLVPMPAALLLWVPALALMCVPLPRNQLIRYGRTVRGALLRRPQPA
jgi:O-antigen/teichoic acid export membrane protein